MSLFQDCQMRLIYCEIGTKMTLNNFGKQNCWIILSYLMNYFFRDLKKGKMTFAEWLLMTTMPRKKPKNWRRDEKIFEMCVRRSRIWSHVIIAFSAMLTTVSDILFHIIMCIRNKTLRRLISYHDWNVYSNT